MNKGWDKKSAECPAGTHVAISDLARSLRGSLTGFTKYSWTLAACLLLEMDRDLLNAAVRQLRSEIEVEPDFEKARACVRGMLRVVSVARNEFDEAARSAVRARAAKKRERG